MNSLAYSITLFSIFPFPGYLVFLLYVPPKPITVYSTPFFSSSTYTRLSASHTQIFFFFWSVISSLHSLQSPASPCNQVIIFKISFKLHPPHPMPAFASSTMPSMNMLNSQQNTTPSLPCLLEAVLLSSPFTYTSTLLASTSIFTAASNYIHTP